MFKTLDVKQQRPGGLRDGTQGDPLTVPAHPWKRFWAVAQGGRPRHRLGNSELGRQSWEAQWPEGARWSPGEECGSPQLSARQQVPVRKLPQAGEEPPKGWMETLPGSPAGKQLLFPPARVESSQLTGRGARMRRILPQLWGKFHPRQTVALVPHTKNVKARLGRIKPFLSDLNVS